jgi:hypothetical protein
MAHAEVRHDIEAGIRAFGTTPRCDAARALLAALGFVSSLHDASFECVDARGSRVVVAFASGDENLADAARALCSKQRTTAMMLHVSGERLTIAIARSAKVVFIRDISIAHPCAAHISVLDDLRRRGIDTLSAESLGRRFLRDVSNCNAHAGDMVPVIRHIARCFLDESPPQCADKALSEMLDNYIFTTIERTSKEEELAIDPEVLGKVHETLLGSCADDDARSSARKHSGSFYTPRPVVDYMVDSALKAYLSDTLIAQGMTQGDASASLHALLACKADVYPLTQDQCAALLAAIRACRIFDPACGAGAFVIGALQKLACVMGKLDPCKGNERAHKRHLIEHCLHGVDIQPLAIEITRLRLRLASGEDIDPHFTVSDALHACTRQRFDIVIGNPPYVKENDDRRRFDGLREMACYQGKMDLWQLFAEAGLDMLNARGVLSFIVPGNWITNAGASKLRDKLMKEATLIELVDFNRYRVFESAGVQTMILTLRKCASQQRYDMSMARANAAFSKHDLDALNEGGANMTRFVTDVDRAQCAGKPLLFNAIDHGATLDAIEQAGTFRLRCDEIAQGIVPNPDRVNARNLAAIGIDEARKRGIEIGDGVFVLNEAECEAIDAAEHVYLKPLCEPVHLAPYFRRPGTLRIIYAKRGCFDAANAPSIVAHLRRFREIMELRRENALGRIAFHHLHWPREESFFKAGEKILAPRKSLSPVFCHTEDAAYVMLSINVIMTRRIDMRYLSAVLNSSTVRYWLEHRGSRQGLHHQLDAAPLARIPIAEGTARQREVVSRLVRLVQERHASGMEPNAMLEAVIDACIVECYFGAEVSLIEQVADLLDAPGRLAEFAKDF